MKPHKILIVEDNPIVSLDISLSLLDMGFTVCMPEGCAEKAVERCSWEHPDVIIMDIRLRGQMDGIEAAERITEHHQIPIIYLTALTDHETMRRAESTIPFALIHKPFDIETLRLTLEDALELSGSAHN